MAYRRYRRGKKYFRRRTLSTRSIYNRRSSKAQANQIYALNKKVNAIARANRPDTYLMVNGPITQQFSNETLASVSKSYGSGLTPHGTYARLLDFTIAGTFEYADNKEAYPGVDVPRAGTIRLVIWQSLSSKASNSVQQIGNLLEISGTGAGYELNTMRPFKPGVTSYVNILYDRTYTVSAANPVRQFKARVKKLAPMRIEAGDQKPQGEVYYGFVTSGLHYGSAAYSEYITCNFIAKLAYNDDM